MEESGKTILRGYVLEDDFHHISGAAQWTFGKKDGKDWFLKRFTNPVRPKNDGSFDPQYVARLENVCNRFYKSKRALYDAVNSIANGNIVTIEEFFMYDNRYHIVTERIPTEPVTEKDIARLSEEEKILLLKTITNSMVQLHQKQIIYADIRPDNVLFKRSQAGKLIAKLIDFDGCFFEYDPPKAEALPISEKYIAPETALVYFDGERIKLTTKLDVYSLGLLFHLYWTGEMPDFDENKYDYAFEPVLDGTGLTLSPFIPPRLSALMRMMMLKNPADRPTMEEVFLELKCITGDGPDSNPSRDRIKPNHGGGFREPTDDDFFSTPTFI